ncbi:dihydrodipicolinate synthase family protein [Achromobacter pestifer]|nr:dihydrodipicolinate synthase family protein [Achromobacter pestifer]
MATDIFVPLITPIDYRGMVCGPSVQRLLSSLRHSANGFIPCLTSGEGWRLSATQWEDMLRFTLEHAGASAVIAGIEQPSTAEVHAYAESAKRLGAHGVMLTSPFGESVTQAGILDHYRRVHDAVDLSIYVYNESSLSGNETLFDTLLAIAALPRVVGIKDSADVARSSDQIKALQAQGLKYYVGWEHQLGEDLPVDGCVVSLANIEPALCRVALACECAAVRSEVTRLTEAYALQSDDWYVHIKKELFSRGAISTARAATS